MSHTNTTTNYGLPQFLSSDKPAWMADINVAFADIDAQMKTNADAASAAQTTADDAVLNGAPGYSNLSTYAVGDVVNYLGRVYKCDIAVTTPEAFDNAKWSYYRLADASAQLDVIDDEIGSTDISGVGDGSITGAISKVNSDLIELVSGTQIIDDIISAGGSWAATTFKPSADKLYRIVPNFRGQGADTTNANLTSIIVKGSDLLNTSSACPFTLHGDFISPATALGLFYEPNIERIETYRGANLYNTYVYHFVVYELA